MKTYHGEITNAKNLTKTKIKKKTLCCDFFVFEKVENKEENKYILVKQFSKTQLFDELSTNNFIKELNNFGEPC